MSLAVAFLSATLAQAENVLTFSPSSTSVTVGSPVTLQVRIDSATNFAGYQFDLLFDNSLFSSTSISDGDVFTTGGNSDFFIPGSVSGGTISGNANSLFGATGVDVTNGWLASFTFQSLLTGVGAFSFDLIDLIDGNGNQITPGTPGTAQVSVNPASATPEPASWTLLGGGMLAAGLLRRRLGIRFQ